MFVIIEGPNGAGKTTLINNFKDKGVHTLSSPAGTPLAQMLRPVARATEPWEDVDKVIQFLCFSAARIDEYLRLVHNKDELIVADRWWTSTYVYQCTLQGISVQFLEHTVHPEEKVDAVIILDAEDDILIGRVENERKMNPSHGACAWTRDNSSQKELIRIYREKLPSYLKTKNIPCYIVDTSHIDSESVFKKVNNIIESIKEDKI